MAVDKLVDSTQLDADLTSVANAIRTKGGTSASLAFPSGFVSAIEAISGGSVQYKTGTYTPTADYTTDGNRSITTVSSIGFTPKVFIFCVNSRSSVSGKLATLCTCYLNVGGANYKAVMRYTNTSGAIGGGCNGTNWTTNEGSYLYKNSGGTIYYHTNQNYPLYKDVQYDWYAYA